MDDCDVATRHECGAGLAEIAQHLFGEEISLTVDSILHVCIPPKTSGTTSSESFSPVTFCSGPEALGTRLCISCWRRDETAWDSALVVCRFRRSKWRSPLVDN